ncbi:hypothetical protein ACLUWO_05180 [Pseudoscardovia radai]|uniref:hypothetical protein n=1 Tax=Pseudoscardovia radai TaxID=987066 RepID=UPI003994A931
MDRYVACIAVAYPHDRDTFPAQAAETVKPIIDAGTEYGLWPDDDSTHRCATVYFRAPGHAPAHRHRLTVFIIPVPSRPAYVVSRDLNQTIIDAARDRGQAYRAASLQFTVPFGLWVTSNITDSDILARQHGHRKASTWGGRRAQGVREQTIGTLRSMGADKWRRTGASLTGTPFITFAGIRYATDRDADPDNAAETVDALMRAGADAGRIDGVSGTQCKATVFFRLKGKAAPSEHDVKLYAVAIPDGTQWLDLLLDSCDRAWRRGGTR